VAYYPRARRYGYGKDPDADRILQAIELIEETDLPENAEEIRKVVLDGLNELISIAFPQVKKAISAEQELHQKALELMKSEGLEYAVACGKVLKQDKELFARLRGRR